MFRLGGGGRAVARCRGRQAKATRRQFLGAVPAFGAAFSVAGAFTLELGSARAQQAPLAGHFHPMDKAPSAHTIAALKQARAALPFDDTRDLEENARGLIAEMPEMAIPADSGRVAWDMERFRFLDEDREFELDPPFVVAPVAAQQQLRALRGDARHLPGARVRPVGHNLRARQDRMDRLRSTGQRRAGAGGLAALPGACRRGAVGQRSLIYSHTHGDHWGGVRGLIDAEDVRAGRIEVIAPVDFMDFTVSENVYAGNAMNRRLFYQYGLLLPASPHGFVGQGLGQGVLAGATGLIAPTRLVTAPIEEFEVDGVRMIFQNTPNTEAPREMNTYIPDMKALWMAENVVASLHNIYTLRGAQVRDPLNWSKYIAETLYLYGQEAEVMFASHHWPRWGNARIQEVLRAQRDLCAHMNNQVLHLVNQGVTINQIHNVYALPDSLLRQWHCRGYHGSAENNARGVIQRYLGYWDANPATLIPLSPKESAPLYVEMMGGAGPILDRGRALHDSGDYLLAIEIVNKLVQAEPENAEARELLADIFEQIGYQQENPGLRNSFLAAAYELRSGIPQGETADSASPDVIRAMSTELFLNFLGIRMDSRKAEGLEFTINLVTPDNGEMFIVELKNATLTNIRDFQAQDPDLTLTIDRAELELTMTGEKSLEAQLADGVAQAVGDVSILAKLAATMVDFDPRFEIMPGTRTAEAIDAGNPFEARPGRVSVE